jgi:hypothetical protein
MKVKELIKLLKDVHPEFQVVLSNDAEGNGYSPAVEPVICDYVPDHPDNTWSGFVKFADYEEEDPDYVFEPNAIVLFPTN